MMKKCFLSIGFIVLLCACGPQAKFLEVESLSKAEYELDFIPENTSVFFIAPNSGDSLSNVMDSLYLSKVAIAVAEKLEKDREEEDKTINVYSIPEEEFYGFDNPDDDNYFNDLMLKSGSEVEIFLRDLDFKHYTVQNTYSDYEGEYNSVNITIPYAIKLDVYDAMKDSLLFSKNQNDTVYLQALSTNNSTKNYDAIVLRELSGISQKIGEKLASYLSKQWEQQTIMLIDYDHLGNWRNACSMAMDEFKWDDAIKLWMPYTQTNNPRRAAYAAFNIAVGCQMSGHFDLALKWIQFAEKQYNFRELQVLKSEITKL